MKTKMIAFVFLILAALAFGQANPSNPNQTFSSGTAAASTRPCNDAVYVGSQYTQVTNPSVTSVCSQIGASSLGAGAYGWTTASSGGGNVVVAAGKTLTVDNTLELAGTDSTVMTFPSTSDTVVGLAATQTLTNKTLTSPTLTTPTLGVATATSINKVTITAPATAATLTIANNKTLTASNTLTLAGTDSTVMTFPSTSATIARTDAANTFTGIQTLSSAPVLSTSTLTSGAGTITFPTSSITVSGAAAQDCGTAAGACSATNTSTTLKVVRGTAAATSASPSTVAITGMSPAFTSATSYSCIAEDATTATNVFVVLTAGYVSGSAVTFTGPNTLTDTIRYICIGN